MSTRKPPYQWDETVTEPAYDTVTSNTPVHLFDVTCVVGSVYSGGDTDESPRDVAFRLISQHGADGTFSFPEMDGSMTSVTVQTTKEKK